MKRELDRLLRSLRFAGAGLIHLFRSQRNARIHLLLTALAIILAWWLGLNSTQWALLALTIGVVLATEAINTAVETIVDLVTSTHHPLAKIAKDTAAAAVLITAIAAIIVALFLFLPPLIDRLAR